ncbi:general transcription factor II-I repeat domain-containing protein 2A [Trichonephila clavipes]|nr:general transcription factor II-I repeat domain-containing protein 2A [Trichonephila clavipes]
MTPPDIPIFYESNVPSRRGNVSPFARVRPQRWDICQYFNKLNIKLHGPHKNSYRHDGFAFEAKLYVLETILLQKLQVLPKLEKNITDLDAQEKRNEEKVIDDFISIMDSLIKEFSARFSQFKELSETFKFIMYPDVISFDKLNLSQFNWLEIEELEMQLIDFSLVQYGFKSLLKQGKKSWN